MIWDRKELLTEMSTVDLDVLQATGTADFIFPSLQNDNGILPPLPSVHWLVLMTMKNASSTNSFWAEYRKIITLVNDTVSCYRTHNIDGRTVYIANHHLKKYQRWVLENILNTVAVSKFATAYIKERSAKVNAEPHVGHRIVVKTDIRHFFDSITYKQVYRAFAQTTNYSMPVLTFLSKLCCLNGHLPQGVCTSPALSNICMLEIDIQIGKYCAEKGIAYTRYSDDMTFSADEFDIDELLRFVESLLAKNGFCLNKRKTRILRSGVSHNVTGVVCNKKISVPAEYKRKIRQEMHYIEKFGLREHLKRTDETKYNDIGQVIRYLYNLIGRINYIISVESDNSVMRAYRDASSQMLDVCKHELFSEMRW